MSGLLTQSIGWTMVPVTKTECSGSLWRVMGLSLDSSVVLLSRGYELQDCSLGERSELRYIWGSHQHRGVRGSREIRRHKRTPTSGDYSPSLCLTQENVLQVLTFLPMVWALCQIFPSWMCGFRRLLTL